MKKNKKIKTFRISEQVKDNLKIIKELTGLTYDDLITEMIQNYNNKNQKYEK